MSPLTTLIEQHHAFLHFQDRISKAIYNRDERLLMQLDELSRELFFQIDANRTSLIATFDSQIPYPTSFQSDLAQLVQVMEQAQRQVQKNEMALETWLKQMKSDAQYHRQSQSPRGVLAAYLQQRQGSSSQGTNLDNSSASSEIGSVDSGPPPSPSPWMISGKASDMMGHQVNHQS